MYLFAPSFARLSTPTAGAARLKCIESLHSENTDPDNPISYCLLPPRDISAFR